MDLHIQFSHSAFDTRCYIIEAFRDTIMAARYTPPVGFPIIFPLDSVVYATVTKNTPGMFWGRIIKAPQHVINSICITSAYYSNRKFYLISPPADTLIFPLNNYFSLVNLADTCLAGLPDGEAGE
jgi:hypothetical protein